MKTTLLRVAALLALTAPPLARADVESIVDATVPPRKDSSGKRNFVGLSVVVVKNGQPYMFHYGEAVLGSGVKPNDDTLYAIGSITKSFTATLLALFHHRGLVRLPPLPGEGPSRFLPTKLKDVVGLLSLPSPRDEITLEQLATHHSGLERNPPGGESPYQTGTYAGDFSALMYTLTSCTSTNPCNATIASTSSDKYSNYGYAVLAYVLAELYDPDTTVRKVFHDEITEPLAMVDTDNKKHLTEDSCLNSPCDYSDYGECDYKASCNKTFSKRAAVGYGVDQTTRAGDEGSDDNVKAGSGVMWSTPSDMAIWLGYHMNAWPSVAWWPQELDDIRPSMHTPRMGDMALAFRRMTTDAGHVVLAKSGVLDGSFTAYMAWIENGTTGVIVLMNSDYEEAGDLCFDLIDALEP